MRKKMISYIICALMFGTVLMIEVPKVVNAQVNEEWVARYNGPSNERDEARDICVDSEGNVYVTGNSRGNGTWYDYATVKYDPYGNELWSARYNGPKNGFDYSYCIAVDDSGNVYVTGESHGTGVEYQDIDYATIKYDEYGNELWVARYSGPGNMYDRPNAMALDDSGNVYITGFSDWDSGVASDIATVAYDSNGTELWVAIYSAGASYYGDIGTAVAVGSSGNIYVAGYSYTSSTSWDFVTLAYDSNGNELWNTRYNGPVNGSDIAWGMVIDSVENVYVTGHVTTRYLSSVESITEYKTIAYDSSGNELWNTKFDNRGNQHNGPKAMAIDPFGRIYVTGYTWNNSSIFDYATVAYDENGNELWNATYNGPANRWDEPFDMACDSEGNVYVTGRSQGIGTGSDYATVAYDSSGIEIWVARFAGPRSYDDWSRAIAVDSSGGVYVTGRSMVAGRSYDFTTIKYSAPRIEPSIDIDPDTLNLKSKGKWITCYITLNEHYDVNDIDISTILLEDTIPAEWGDIQADTLMVKFDRSEVEDMLSPGTYNLKVTGELTDGTSFEGYSDKIRVIDPGK